MNTEERLIELEIQFAHQDNTIADLNDVILSQQKAIDSLESRLLKVEASIRDNSIQQIKDPSDESPPPHY